MIRNISIGLFVVLTMTGCAAETAVERDFGNSVRHMVRNQLANPERAMNPAIDAIDGTDAGRLESVFETYRTDVGRPEGVERSIDAGAKTNGGS